MKIILAIAVLVLCFAALSLAVDTDDFVKQSITDNKVMVFSKSYCPYVLLLPLLNTILSPTQTVSRPIFLINQHRYCRRAKETLNGYNANMKVIELDQHGTYLSLLIHPSIYCPHRINSILSHLSTPSSTYSSTSRGSCNSAITSQVNRTKNCPQHLHQRKTHWRS